MQRARAWLDDVIFAEIRRRHASGERGTDLLSLLMDASDEDGSQLAEQELRDQVMTLLFAGHDTTTSTVTFLFYELARNPGDHDLDLAIDETLRMYPPAWIGPRRSIEPFELCGVRVPGGVLVNYSSWVSHHLAEVFPEPFEFRPERFKPEARAALPKGAYVPFGGGSRTCIGMRFGLLEVRTIAAAILERFRLELADPGLVPSIRQMPTLSPRGGLPVVVSERAA
jgi:cytochrome P450